MRILHTGGNLFKPGTKPWSHRFESIGLSARRCQCPSPKTLSNALACLKNVPNGRAIQFPDSITEKWPLTTDRYPSSIRNKAGTRIDALKETALEKRAVPAHIPRMATIVHCDCGAEYKRTETKFLVPHTGHASCKVCGATLESWLESTHVATFELVKRPDRKPA